jgi:dCMP deaminase
MPAKTPRALGKWDVRWLAFARHVSTWSKDPSTKVGAVITLGKDFVSLGYNGFPEGIEDTPERLNNRELKYAMTVHAEANAVIKARRSVQGHSMYVWPFMPCSSCAGKVIQAGISEVISCPNDNPRWQESFRVTEAMFKEAGVALRLMPQPELPG